MISGNLPLLNAQARYNVAHSTTEVRDIMKVFKILGGLVGLLVALIIAALIYVSMNLNSLVKQAVEDVGPKLTQTPVKLNEVDITLSEGRLSLRGFVIENPEAFTSPSAFQFDEFTVQLKPESLTNDVVVIQDIVINGIGITAEQVGTQTNLLEIKKSIDSYLPPGSPQSQEQSAGQGKRFMVERLRFADANLKVLTEKYGERTVAVPGFEMKNIGNTEEGVTAEQLASMALKALTDRAKKAAEKEIQNLVTDEAKAKVQEKLEERKQEGLDKLKGLIND